MEEAVKGSGQAQASYPSYAIDELPDPLRQLIDPATPLPAEWMLIGDGLPPLLPPLALCTAAWLSALIFALPVPNTQGALAWIYAGIALGALLYGIAPALRAWRAIRGRMWFRAGSWRQGLFLGPSELLLWDGTRGVVVSRSQVDQLQRVEIERPATSRSARRTIERRAMLSIRRPDHSTDQLALPMVDPGAADQAESSPSAAALEAWIAGRPASADNASPDVRRGWLRNVALGHAMLLVVSIVGSICAALIAYLIGISAGALLGLLLGFPLFLGFPVLLRAFVGRYLARDANDRPIGWAYFMSLGLAAMILIIVGANLAGTLLWQLRASEAPPLEVGEISADTAALRLFPWTGSFVPSARFTGYHVHRRSLGDASWIESSYYVALMDSQRGCVWLGMRTGEGAQSRRSQARLLEQRTEWLAPVVGLASAGYAKAVENARTNAAGAIPSCVEAIVLEPSASLAQRRAESFGELALINALAHGLPLLALGLWALRRWDSRPLLLRGHGQGGP